MSEIKKVTIKTEPTGNIIVYFGQKSVGQLRKHVSGYHVFYANIIGGHSPYSLRLVADALEIYDREHDELVREALSLEK